MKRDLDIKLVYIFTRFNCLFFLITLILFIMYFNKADKSWQTLLYSAILSFIIHVYCMSISNKVFEEVLETEKDYYHEPDDVIKKGRGRSIWLTGIIFFTTVLIF